MFNKKQKKQAGKYVDLNPVEAIRDLGSSAVDQMFGVGDYSEKSKNKNASGDLLEGQEIDLSRESTPSSYVEPAYDYRREIIHGETKIQQENSRIIQVQIQEIIIELKKLTSASNELKIEFKDATTAQLPVNAGKYHVSFFEWLLASIRTARMRVEESANWLSMFTSKKKKRQYWNMFKKHGTTFGLSNERVVSTQTG